MTPIKHKKEAPQNSFSHELSLFFHKHSSSSLHLLGSFRKKWFRDRVENWAGSQRRKMELTHNLRDLWGKRKRGRSSSFSRVWEGRLKCALGNTKSFYSPSIRHKPKLSLLSRELPPLFPLLLTPHGINSPHVVGEISPTAAAVFISGRREENEMGESGKLKDRGAKSAKKAKIGRWVQKWSLKAWTNGGEREL